MSRTLVPLVLLALAESTTALWPAPRSYTKGNTALFVNPQIQVTYNGQPLAYLSGYEPTSIDSREIVQGGISRSLGSIFERNFVPWKLTTKNKINEFEPALGGNSTSITSLAITQAVQDQPSVFKALAGEVDESYCLTISQGGTAELSANSSIGVLHGLETFSQLFYQHSTSTSWYTPYAPVSIEDEPVYPHRGVLFDTARQWYPVANLLRTIDAMSWNKMNRLHVHVTDSQSWPLDLPSMPEVAREGAHRRDLIYTADDIRRVQEFGVHRGVQVYFEIDMPGHIGSLHHSHPELIVAYNEQPYYHYCAQPPCGAFKLNDTRVDAFLDKMFNDVLPRVHPYSAYWHTGGDELNANDSMLDENIRSNKSEVLQPLLQTFIDKQHERVRSHDLTPVVWEEIPLDWNVTLGKDVPVQSWLGNTKKLVTAGHQVIDSNYNFWYLDCGRGQWINMDNGAAFEQFYPFNDWCGPTKSWALVYSHDPRAGLSEDEAKLVLGGEVAVWSESIDEQTIDSIIWPRAGAAGEVLWSGRVDPATGQNRSQLAAIPRLSEMRERLIARGLRPAALTQLWCTQANPTECSQPL